MFVCDAPNSSVPLQVKYVFFNEPPPPAPNETPFQIEGLNVRSRDPHAWDMRYAHRPPEEGSIFSECNEKYRKTSWNRNLQDNIYPNPS